MKVIGFGFLIELNRSIKIFVLLCHFSLDMKFYVKFCKSFEGLTDTDSYQKIMKVRVSLND